ncbi:MAG: hypothetical protein AB1757_13685 [Acidobacteriota bacterium]
MGLTIEQGEPIRIITATGDFLAYRHYVTLKLLDYEFDIGVCFAADDDYNRDVLGRQGFLDRMRLGLVGYEGRLYLSRYLEELS